MKTSQSCGSSVIPGKQRGRMKKKYLVLAGLLTGALLVVTASCSQAPSTSPAAPASTQSSAGGTAGSIIYGIWGSSPSDIFAVGSDAAGKGMIRHYDGNSWQLMNIPVTANIYGIWGTSASDVYAVGGDDIILHYDGDTWTTMNIPTSNPLF